MVALQSIRRGFSMYLMLGYLIFAVASPGLAQDNDELLFTKEVNGNRDIYVIRSDGSGERALTNDDGEQSSPAWSPDRQSIAYISAVDTGSEIFVMSASGDDVTKVTETNTLAREPTWSPDGRKIVFVSGSGDSADLFMVDAEGGEAVALTNDDFEDYDPVFTPDGESIVFVSVRDENDFVPELYILEINSGKSEVFLTTVEGEKSALSFAPDGSRMAYVLTTYDAQGSSFELYISDIDGDNSEPLTRIEDVGTYITSTTWSPNSDAIAYTISHRQGQQISIISIGEYEITSLTSEDDNAFEVSWSTPEVNAVINYPTNSNGDPEEVRGLIGRVRTERLNIRSEPREDAYMVALLYTGEEVRIIGRNYSGDWYLVDTGVVGWAYARNLVTRDDMAQLEVWEDGVSLPASQFYQTINCPGSRGPTFNFGDRFVVPFGDGPTSVYDEPNRIPRLGQVFEGQGGTVIAGPFCTGGQRGNLLWWYVESDSGLKGYMSEGYLSDAIAWMAPE